MAFDAFIKSMAALGDPAVAGSVAAYYTWIKERAVPVAAVPVSSVKLLDTTFTFLKVKECYGNAIRVALRNPNVKYVEGYVVSRFVPVPLPHAWNSINGVHFDVTREVVLKEDPADADHRAVIELDGAEAALMHEDAGALTVLEWYYRKNVIVPLQRTGIKL